MDSDNDSERFYVYIYIDPRNFEWFYCGKGQGSRKKAHLFDTGDSDKAKRIREIVEAGQHPIIRVIAKGLAEKEALLVEKTAIWCSELPKGPLLNDASGCFAEQFRPRYSLHRELAGFDYHHRIYFFNVGDGPRRNWEFNCERGYVGAGHGPVYRDAVKGLHEGDVIAAYLSRKRLVGGFVGVGVVESEAMPARDFQVNGELLYRIKDKHKPGKIADDLDDENECEWMAAVRWERTVARDKAYFTSKPRLFTPPLVRAALENQPQTIGFIERNFKVDLFTLANT